MYLYYKSGKIYCKIEKEEKHYFYEDGTVKTIERYKNSRLHGEILLYWPNGQLKRKVHFKKGLRHGTDEMYSKEGTLLDTDCYVEGLIK
jgi:antitoxin component YwqK of YwqJK toxin-antitoxin module